MLYCTYYNLINFTVSIAIKAFFLYDFKRFYKKETDTAQR
ncbi:hypothetical protein HMPREF9554_00109 [Treponema phagedenis F0421]|nr:hypothetical protein HMPREF9554_00109 [Treponema phagedenis F0421]